MYAKIEITGTIEVVTGLHIGGSTAFSAIGAVDAPVVKDVLSGAPMIPGSSLKGKMRTLLAKKYNTHVAQKPDEDAPCLVNLFGSAKKYHIKQGRLLFSDMIMNNWEELRKLGLTGRTEVKFENSINRVTAVANPRQIERVVRGAKFPLSLIYEWDKDTDMKQDFQIIADGLKLLEYDYLGGSGSRGYGKVKFSDLALQVVVGDVDEETEKVVKACEEILNSK